MKTNILWVEDEAESSLVARKNYLEGCGLYNLTIMRNASHAEEAIRSKKFDKIIFDIRIPPGFSQKWENLHNNGDYRLGLALVEDLYPKLSENKIPFGICTVERWADISERVLTFDPSFDNKNNFIMKGEIVYPEDFVDFIENLK